MLGMAILLCQWVTPDYGMAHLGVHAAAVGAGCRATPVHTTPFRRQDLRGIPWLTAAPTSAGITGYLFFRRPGARGTAAYLHAGGTMPDGATTKILWVVRNARGGRVLSITGRNLTGGGTMRQLIPRASSPATDYPSILNVPAPGCWQLQLRSGNVQGTVTMPVIS
jgi:hypothetical protein